MTTPAELQAKIEKLEVNMTRFDTITNGDDTTTVTVDNDIVVPSVAKLMKDIEDSFSAMDVIVRAEQAVTDAHSWANLAEDQQYTDADGRQGFSSFHWSEKSKQTAEEAKDWVLLVGLPEVSAITSDLTIDASNMEDYKNHLLACDTSAGSITINMPAISILGEPYSIRVKKADSSENTVTFKQAVGDKIDGSDDPVVISVKDAGYRFDTDADPDPDNWVSTSFGKSADVQEATYHFVTSAGQTVFTGMDRYGNTLAYEVGHVEVYLGSTQIWEAAGDFTAADGISVVIDNTFDPIPGQEVVIRARSAFSVANTLSTSEIDAKIAAVPTGAEIGTVAFFARETGHLGWLPLNGSAVLRSSYEDLDAFVYVGDANNATAPAFYHCTDSGDPDGSRDPAGDYLYLPDTRGNALRALDGGRGVDVGRVLGSEQLDQMQQIVGTIDEGYRGVSSNFDAGDYDGAFSGHIGSQAGASGSAGSNVVIEFDSANSPGARVGDETRMRNTAFPLFIKAFYPVPVPTPGPQGVNKAGDLMLGELRGQDAVSDDGYTTKQQVEAKLAVHLQAMKLHHVVADGGDGGSPTTNAWTDRTLTLESNSITGASFSGGYAVLPPGVYEVSSMQTFYMSKASCSRVYAVSGDSVEIRGSDAYFSTFGTSGGVVPTLPTVVTLTSSTELSLQYHVSSDNGNDGLGLGNGLTGFQQKYAELNIRRLA